MQEIKQIDSLQNPTVKTLISIKEKSRQRKKTGLFVLEGIREFQLALKADYAIKMVLYNPAIMPQAEFLNCIKSIPDTADFIEVSNEVYKRIAYREKTEGIVAVVEAKSHTLESLTLKTKNPLILVAEAPEKPGNIGALLRTADAANLDAVLIANPRGDMYNPNIIRSSVGCVFTVDLAVGSTSEILNFLKTNRIQVCAADLSGSVPYTQTNFKSATAIVVGTESTGLTAEWLEQSDQRIYIPMEGEIDSMNVSVSAAILIFEAKRQRL